MQNASFREAFLFVFNTALFFYYIAFTVQFPLEVERRCGPGYIFYNGCRYSIAVHHKITVVVAKVYPACFGTAFQ